MLPRIIPTLLISGRRLVKTTKFSQAAYLGDPINAIKIFNDKEVDEIAILDINASKRGNRPNFDYISEIASECFIPLMYGGGITSTEDIAVLLKGGVDKILINSANFSNPNLLHKASKIFGSQSLVAGIDVKMNLFRRWKVSSATKRNKRSMDPTDYAAELAEMGAGEIFLYSVDRDGTYSGYDFELIRAVSQRVSVPVIACGGAKDIPDLMTAIATCGASAAAAGSLFVYQRKGGGVLINYPSPEIIESTFQSALPRK